MKFDVLQIFGMVVTVIGGQGVIRLLLDHGYGGLLSWLPEGFAARLGGYVALIVAGVLIAGWAHDRAKALGRRK